MSEYKFKQLSEIDTIEAPAEGTTVMGLENGKPIQMPMGSVKGTSGVFLIDPDDAEYDTANPTYGDKIKDALLSGKQVWVRSVQQATTSSATSNWTYSQVYLFRVVKLTTGGYHLEVYAAGVSTTTSPTLSASTFAITA